MNQDGLIGPFMAAFYKAKTNPMRKRRGSYGYYMIIQIQVQIQSATVNSSPSKFRFFVRINQGATLIVHLGIGSQWSLSREIVVIKRSA